ncbi:hypothetical protein ACOI1C_02040 [Bacillus sp. DJP31]|uniref:hypothetical protein n=1 Tax=Bacillus sp. DJP31 TaxID=3409789 RepID=UPI003BB61560
MNMFDVFLWVIIPCTFFTIFIMSIIWKYDYPLQNENNETTGFQLEKLTVIIFNLSFLGFIISGVVLLSKFGAITIFTYLINWIVGLITLNPDMNQLSNQPILLLFHLLFAFLLFMVSFKHRKHLDVFIQCLISMNLFRKKIPV